MDFDEVLDAVSAEAMAAQLEPDSAATWRRFCRTFSKKFNTPLMDVMKLSPEEVALHVFEDNLDERDGEDNLIEHLLDLIYTMSDPEYAQSRQEELEEFIKNAREEEDSRVKEGRAIHPSLETDDQRRDRLSAARLRRQDTQTMTDQGVQSADQGHQDVSQNEPTHPQEPNHPTSGFVDLSRLREDDER
jgi:hypothetical protein